MSYDPKNQQVLNRALKVQKLSIPFAVTGNATPASVVLANDEPALMFLKSEGVDQITAALASGETATYLVAPVDATGIMNVLVKINESVLKVVSMTAFSRSSGAPIAAKLGSASGITTGSGGGSSIMVTTDSTVNYASANEDACLEIEYIVAE